MDSKNRTPYYLLKSVCFRAGGLYRLPVFTGICETYGIWIECLYDSTVSQGQTARYVIHGTP